MNRMLRASGIIYRWLLHVYPARFRQLYGREMAEIFDLMVHDAAQKQGKWGIARLWLSTLCDLLINALAVHFSGGNRMIRRWFDLTLSLSMLCLGLSVFPAIALLIKLDSPGPIFYRGTKLGKDGRPYQLIKLRTMIPTQDGAGRQVTRVGALLRQTYLDEWPSFINVLLGDMSLIGPRPQSPDMTDDVPALTAKPGLMPSLLCLHSM